MTLDGLSFEELHKFSQGRCIVEGVSTWHTDVRARLKSAMRQKAAMTPIPQAFEYSLFRKLPARLYRDRQHRLTLAWLIFKFCRAAGAVARVSVNNEDDFLVSVMTNSVGKAVLTHLAGLKWEDIQTYCRDMNVDAEKLFWWLPVADDRTGWKINPSNWPVNTPDWQVAANSLISMK